MVDHKLRKYSHSAESVVGLRGTPLRCQECPLWPKERVNETLPFQYTGLDYFGHQGVSTKHRQRINTSYKESLGMFVHLLSS